MRHDNLTPEYVHFMPEPLQAGTLYISKDFGTAIHLCACGCGNKVVTPLNPQPPDDRGGWDLIEHPDGTVTLCPSVGNQQLPCRTHYSIRNNKIVWYPDFA